MDTGRKIMNLRRDLGVQQKDLAILTAVTPSALSRIESGTHQPRGPVALRIARNLGVTVDYLLDADAPYPPPPHELLVNLLQKGDDNYSESMELSKREKRVIAALRNLDQERRTLLEAIITAPRDKVRSVTDRLSPPKLPALKLSATINARKSVLSGARKKR